MKKAFGWLSAIAGFIAAICATAFLSANAFVMRDPVLQEFILAYGIQFIMCFAALSLVMSVMERSLPKGYSTYHPIGPVLFIAGWFLVGACLVWMIVVPYEGRSLSGKLELLVPLLVAIFLFGGAALYWPLRSKSH